MRTVSLSCGYTERRQRRRVASNQLGNNDRASLPPAGRHKIFVLTSAQGKERANSRIYATAFYYQPEDIKNIKSAGKLSRSMNIRGQF